MACSDCRFESYAGATTVVISVVLRTCTCRTTAVGTAMASMKKPMSLTRRSSRRRIGRGLHTGLLLAMPSGVVPVIPMAVARFLPAEALPRHRAPDLLPAGEPGPPTFEPPPRRELAVA